MTIRSSSIICAMAGFGALFACGRANAGDDDAKSLVGKWRVVSAEYNGANFLEDHKIDGKLFVVFERNTVRVFVEGTKSEQVAQVTLDSKRKPKHIDFTKATLDNKWPGALRDKLFQSWALNKGLTETIPAKTKVQGIYKLAGDSLTLCWRNTKVADDIDVRPSKFESILYYWQFLLVLERVKPE